jgi:cbb3-type cytochrome oxidase cytochrome c subunit
MRMSLGPVLAGPALLAAIAYGVTVVVPATADENSTRTATTHEYTKGAVKGRGLYASNGCVACHTLQRRDTFTDAATGPDASTPGEQLNDDPGLLGDQRYGPDLSCVGDRVPDTAKTRDDKLNWMVAYLQDPPSMHPGSTMPSYRFLVTADLRRLAAYLIEHTCETP